jgi:hypothetical protein
MAIKLRKKTPHKYDFEYWKIDEILINYRTGKVDAVVNGYKNKKARDDNGEFIYSHRFNFDLKDIDYDKDIRSAVYKMISKLIEFKKAKKV